MKKADVVDSMIAYAERGDRNGDFAPSLTVNGAHGKTSNKDAFARGARRVLFKKSPELLSPQDALAASLEVDQ